MGIGTRRPPLPAPTDDPTDESVVQAAVMDDSATDVATNVSRRTDATSYTVPEDGRSITIPTDKRILAHGRNKSQTSLLIEYFEGSKSGGSGGGRPSVRVKVTPSSKRKAKSGSADAVQITGIGKDRKPSYTERISLGTKSSDKRCSNPPPLESTELSHSSESNLSSRPPVEVEILNHGSDVSNNHSRMSRDLQYTTANPSEISSMPPDSLAGSEPSQRPHSPLIEQEAKAAIHEHLSAPANRDRSRSVSRERITQKVMEKLKQRAEKPVEYEPDNKPTKERRRRPSKSHHTDETMTNTESSLLSSSATQSQTSYRSGATSKVSLNNPRLLEMVEDTVRRLILPEIDQLKNEQRTERNLHDFESDRRESYTDSRDSYGEGLDRRLSKSSSSPNMVSKPKVVLNRYDDNPGEVLSRGDSERKSERRKHRKSSRESVPTSERSERRSSKGDRDETVHRKKSKDSHRLRDAAAAGVAGGVLTAAALRHHDSRDGEDDREKRKRRSKTRSHDSRSRSASIQEAQDESYRKEEIPPMPFASAINESDVTRTSLLSDLTERVESRQSEEFHTPLKEVSRYSLREGLSRSSQTPTQSNFRLDATHSNPSLAESSPTSPTSPQSISTKARIAALAAAGLGGAERHVEEERRKALSPKSKHGASPAQSLSSLKHDPLIPQGLRPRSNLSHASSLPDQDAMHSEASAREAEHDLEEHLRPASAMSFDGPGTPRGEETDAWFNKQHEENERYRQSIAESSLNESLAHRPHTRYTDGSNSSTDGSGVERDVRHVATQPQYVHQPHDAESAVASLLEPSMVSSSMPSSTGTTDTGKSEEARYQNHMAQSLRDINGASPAPHEIAAVAESEQNSPTKSRWSALREQAEALSARDSPNESGLTSPPHSDSKFQQEFRPDRESTPVQMGASGLPLADDPMPEIGHGMDNVSEISEISTNPPEIQGTKPKGDRQRWSYDTDGFLRDHVKSRDDMSPNGDYGGKAALFAAGAAAGAFSAGHAFDGSNKQSASPRVMGRPASVEDEYDTEASQAKVMYPDRAIATPDGPAVQHGDEGYSSAANALSPGAITPRSKYNREYTKEQLAEYDAAMGRDDDDDLYTGPNKIHARHFSANSHGLASPPYDSSTGKGIDRIQSEDVVALMDHLTVRDAQRNARDTEILVTLVRSAAEMRQEFDALRKFIAEEDRMIMNNTDRDADLTVQKVLGGPRPMPGGVPAIRSPRTSSYESHGEDNATKRKNIFKRALKGLSSRNNNDLGRIEDMLNQLLGDVEVLKGSQGISNRPAMSTRTDSFDSYNGYDDRRAALDPGYEPEGQAGTSPTPNQSGKLSISPSREKHFHSGYDGRRGSVNRVSTVMEGDEDSSSLDSREADLLDGQFEINDRLHTPTQESYNNKRGSGGSFGTPPQARGSQRELASPEQRSPDKQRKSTSLFGIPKFSRWSKTTSSTDPDYKRKSYQSYHSQNSRSGDSLDQGAYYDNSYALNSDDRLRSTQSLAREQNKMEANSVRSGPSTLNRTPSPLMPSETSSQTHSYREPLMSGGAGHSSPVNELRHENLQRFEQDHEDMDAASFEDPKYQAHRNSLLLQHPQPRAGPTHRHQTTLENEARTFSGEINVPSGLTDSDVSAKTADSDTDPAQWGSNPSLSLARTKKIKDDGPLVPQAAPSARQQQQEREDAEARRREQLREEENAKKPKHAYDRMYYSSPLASAGHLLEPIPEVRYSLETDSHSIRSGHRSPEPSARPSVATNGGPAKASPARKITGPRPMGSKGHTGRAADEHADEQQQNGVRSGTVRRKPVAAGSKDRGHGSPKRMTIHGKHDYDGNDDDNDDDDNDEEEEGGWGTWKGGRQH